MGANGVNPWANPLPKMEVPPFPALRESRNDAVNGPLDTEDAIRDALRQICTYDNLTSDAVVELISYANALNDRLANFQTAYGILVSLSAVPPDVAEALTPSVMKSALQLFWGWAHKAD